MSKEKNKNTFRVAALLLVACLISSVMLSGTFAKYTSEYAGQDTALVARWDFTVSDGTTDLGAPDADPIQALDLFSHAYATHINQIDGDYIIAPGVRDEFTVKMNFLSDVDATVTVGFTNTGSTVAAGLPIEYSVDDGSNWVTIAGLPAAFVARVVDQNASATNGSENTFTFSRSGIDADTATTITQVVKWRWAFNVAEQEGDTSIAYASNDVTDTGFGNTSAGGANRTTYILNVSVKAEQITPETVAITGNTQAGQQLSAAALIPVGAIATYQWQSAPAANGPFADIASATGDTYTTVNPADVNKYIRVLATGTSGFTGTITSAPVGPITAP